MRSALLVLQMLQAKVGYDEMPIDVLYNLAKNAKRVVAIQPILAGSLMLPPCVVKCKTLSEESVHPHRVPIAVSMIVLQPSDPAAAVAGSSDPAAAVAESSDPAAAVVAKRKLTGKRKSTEDAKKPQEKPEEADEKPQEQEIAAAVTKRLEWTFYVTPEWVSPRPNLDEDVDNGIVEWTWCGDESMHPFWAALRRATPKQMSSGGTVTNTLQSNMGYRDMTYTSVTVGMLKSRSGGPVTTTCEVTVPFLTNTVDIPSQAELLLEVEEKGGHNKKGKYRTWK